MNRKAYERLDGKKTEHKPMNEDELCDLAELFKIFGDSTRIKILYDLFDGEKVYPKSVKI